MNAVVCFILIVLVSVVQSSITKDEAMEVLRPISQSCMEETGTTDADVEAMLRHEPADSMTAKCLRACILKKIELMNGNGGFVKDVAMKIAELRTDGDAEKMKIAEQIIDACANVASSDNQCEAAEQYGLCIKDEAAKRGINMQD